MLLPLLDRNPLRWIAFHYVNTALIATSVAAFAAQAAAGPEAALGFAMVPAAVAGGTGGTTGLVPPEATLVTSAFIHGDWQHLGFNMLFLWIFGDNIEDCLGHLRYLAFFLLCAVLAGLAHVAAVPNSTMPTVGASGAISGVLGAYLLLHPAARVWTLVLKGIPLPLPAALVLGVWFLAQLSGAFAEPDPNVAGIAWWAHIGGFVAGLVLVVPFRRKGVPLLDGLGRSRAEPET